MQPLADNNTIKIRPLNLILLFGISQLLLASLSNYSGFSFDEAIWHYIGRNWFRHGLVPYSGGVDNKSPLIYVIYGISDSLFGVNPWFPRLLAIACQCTGIYFVYRIAQQLAGSRAGMIALVLYGLSLSWRSVGGKMVSLTQVYETTSLTLCFWVFLNAKNKNQFFITGLLGGLALGFRFTAGFALLVITIALLQKKSLRALVMFAAGVFTMTACLWSLFSLAGIHISEFFQYAFSDNFISGSVTDRTLDWKLEQFADAFFYSELILFYPLVIIYLFIKKKADIFVLWLVASFIGIMVIGMFARAHLRELLPPLCIMSALAINHLIATYSIPPKAVMWVLLLCFFPKTFEPLLALRRLMTARNHKTVTACTQPYTDNENFREQLGDWIKANTSPLDTVYIAGNSAQAQVYSERISASIYFNATPTLPAKKRLFHDLSSCKPSLVAIPLFPQYAETVDAETRAFINKLVEQNYHLDTCVCNYSIYRFNTPSELNHENQETNKHEIRSR